MPFGVAKSMQIAVVGFVGTVAAAVGVEIVVAAAGVAEIEPCVAAGARYL